MTDDSSGVATFGVQSARNRETNLDRRTMAYLRRRRKRRKAVDAAGFSMLDLGTPVYGWEPGNAAGTAGGGMATDEITVSRIYDQVVGTDRDLVQLSGGAQPAYLEAASMKWARFASGETMVASGLTLPTVCTIQILASIASGGVDAATDALFTLDNGAGRSLTLQAGDAAEFLADLVGVGTGIASVADFAEADLADDTAHLISIEINQTTDVVSVLIDNQIRAVATGFTGTLDGSYSLTLGGSLDFDFGWAYICSDEYSVSEYGTAGTFAETYGATMVSGQLTSRFTVAPALTAAGGYISGQDVETDDGATINLRNTADSFTYAWRAQAAGAIAGETAGTLTLTDDEIGDEVRSEVTNTVLGVAVSANSAYGATVIGVPDAFDIADWDLDDDTGGGTLNVTINSEPANNGSALTDIDYRVDGGAWTSSGGTTSFQITGLTDGVEVDVELRAVNAAGDGPAGDLKSATPTSSLVLSSYDYTTMQQAATSAAMNETGPDAVANSAATVTISAGGHYIRVNSVTVSGSTNYVMRFYAKRGTAAAVKYSVANITHGGNNVAATSFYAGINSSSYTLVEVPFTTAAGQTQAGLYPLRDGGATGTVFLFGFELALA